MAEIKIHVMYTGMVYVAPELPRSFLNLQALVKETDYDFIFFSDWKQ